MVETGSVFKAYADFWLIKLIIIVSLFRQVKEYKPIIFDERMILRLTSRGKCDYEKRKSLYFQKHNIFKRLLMLRLLKNCKEDWSF